MFFDALFYLLGKITFFTGSVLGASSYPKPLSSKEETECLLKMKEGDKDAKEKLIKHNMRLVAHVVKKYSGAAETDDLISVGSIGLIKATRWSAPAQQTPSRALTAASCLPSTSH